MFKRIKEKLYGRDIQNILDKVIRYGYYLPLSPRHVPKMCYSLADAEANELITVKERKKVSKAIHEYIGDSTTLVSALSKSGLSCDYSDCLAVYKDWKNRPKLR